MNVLNFSSAGQKEFQGVLGFVCLEIDNCIFFKQIQRLSIDKNLNMINQRVDVY